MTQPLIKPLRGSATAEMIVDIGERMCAESRFARLGYDRELAEAFALRILRDPLFIGFGYFTTLGQLLGMAVGTCGPTLPFSREIVANEQLLFIDKGHRAAHAAAKLINAFVEEAILRGARDITFSNGTGYQADRVGKLFEFCGLSRVGGLYVMEG